MLVRDEHRIRRWQVPHRRSSAPQVRNASPQQRIRQQHDAVHRHQHAAVPHPGDPRRVSHPPENLDPRLSRPEQSRRDCESQWRRSAPPRVRALPVLAHKRLRRVPCANPGFACVEKLRPARFELATSASAGHSGGREGLGRHGPSWLCKPGRAVQTRAWTVSRKRVSSCLDIFRTPRCQRCLRSIQRAASRRVRSHGVTTLPW